MRLIQVATILVYLGASSNLAFSQSVDWGLPQLMQSMAQIRSASAHFAQRQTIVMLNAPLMSYGTLRYVAPDYVRKTTTAPGSEDFVLDHGVVTLTGLDHQTHRFSLQEAPQIGGLVEGIRATLAGDLPALQKIYDVTFTGNAAGWQLLLRPRDPAVSRFVKWIIIRGSRNAIAAVDTASSDGGHSEMGITEDPLHAP